MSGLSALLGVTTEIEMNVEAQMTNEELQDCIIQTNAMIKSTEPGAERMAHLNRHLLDLLAIQKSRAAMVSLSDA